MSSTKWLVLSVACVCALASSAPAGNVAGPGFFVTPGGLNSSGNRMWAVDVSADPNLIVGGGSSLALEMGFRVLGADLLSVTRNASEWINNPGNSPFAAPISGVQNGVVLNLVTDEAFAALGSVNIYTNGNLIRTLDIVTAGHGPTTINWLGAYSGQGIIAQEGVTYRYSGSVSIPEPATVALALGSVVLVGFARRRSLAT